MHLALPLISKQVLSAIPRGILVVIMAEDSPYGCCSISSHHSWIVYIVCMVVVGGAKHQSYCTLSRAYCQ